MAMGERADRIVRLTELRKLGVDPYPARTRTTHRAHAVHEDADALAATHAVVVIAGRIRALRGHGKSTFLVVEDGSGRMQVYAKSDVLGTAYAVVELLDVGDLVEVEGTCFRTKTNEPTIAASRIALLTKALQPLPEKWHGLTDTETRYRRRELDLIANPEVRAIAAWRAEIVKFIRTYFEAHRFLEVETPVLQPIPGGANARPFVTHHHTLGEDRYLRIAPELYLKRLVVGGLERVFEVARCFRNEGIDRNHNPEFTQVEAYAAYTDYRWLMEFVEQLFHELIRTALKRDMVEFGSQRMVFDGTPFPRRPFRELVLEASGVDCARASDNDLRAVLDRLGAHPESSWERGKLLDELYKAAVRPKLVQPTFVIDHPVELSPLAKRRVEDPTTVERFQLVMGGMEIVNAFSELNDPLDQRERFEAQQRAQRAGDAEAMVVDEEYLDALEIGLPPTAGLGIGIDRLVMLLTGSANLKEVILFPTLKRKE